MAARAGYSGRCRRLLAGLVFAAIGGGVQAQQKDDTVLLTGIVYLHPLDQGGNITTRVSPNLASTALGIPERFESSGTSLSAQDKTTLAFAVAHYFTDQIALEFDAGLPPVVDVRGAGVVAPPGVAGALFNLDLGDEALNPIGSARQWSPALLVQYRLGEPGWKLRPFVAAGGSYTWFTSVRLHSAFARALDQRIGQPLAAAAGKPGPTRSSSDLDAAFTPVVALGAALSLGKHWGLCGSLAMVPFSSTATVTVRAADGSLLASNRSRVNVEALISGLMLSYRF